MIRRRFFMTGSRANETKKHRKLEILSYQEFRFHFPIHAEAEAKAMYE
jgi:hypothetical protein